MKKGEGEEVKNLYGKPFEAFVTISTDKRKKFFIKKEGAPGELQPINIVGL